MFIIFFLPFFVGNLKLTDTQGWNFAEQSRDGKLPIVFPRVGKWPTLFPKGCKVADSFFSEGLKVADMCSSKYKLKLGLDCR